MIWTHIYDLLSKLLAITLSVLLVLQVPGTGDMGVVIMVPILLLASALYFFVLRTVSSYLHCRFTLRMNITMAQAAALNNALSPIFFVSRKWLPLREVKGLDDNIKYEAALKMAGVWKGALQETRQKQITDFKSSSPKKKAATISLYAIVAFFFIAGLFNYPPASYVSELICAVFNTDKYYPMLNSVILILPTVVIFALIEKKLK